jgi:hypothetical protein
MKSGQYTIRPSGKGWTVVSENGRDHCVFGNLKEACAYVIDEHLRDADDVREVLRLMSSAENQLAVELGTTIVADAPNCRDCLP